MKGMPGLYYATRDGERPEWIGSVLYVKGDTAEVRRLYQREDAEPMPMEVEHRPGHIGWSVGSILRRLVGSPASA